MKNKDISKLIQELKTTACIKKFIANNNKEFKKRELFRVFRQNIKRKKFN